MNIELKQLVNDTIADRVKGEYGHTEAIEAIRQELIKANGGSDKFDLKTFRRNPELFEIVETLLEAIVDKELEGDNPLFKTLVEYVDIASGDINEFTTQGASQFIVADSAAGISGIRRQRLFGGERVQVPTTIRGVRVYDVLGRFLSGRVTFTDLVNKVAESYNKLILGDVYKTIASINDATAGLSTDFVMSGPFDEEELAKLIDKVEASTGQTAKIIGTRSALRKVSTANISDQAKSDIYETGYYGKFLGTDMVLMRNALGADGEFMLDDSKLYIIASNDKPVKFVREGNPIFYQKEFMENADHTQEYFYFETWGIGLILCARLGIYDLS